MQTSYQMFIETEVPEGQLIVSRTDLRGNITYANDVFANISGYSIDELVGKPHCIVRHPDMPRSVFRNLWETLKNEQIWKGFVKNLRKDGGYYWVYAEISGVYKDGKLVEYKSMRMPMSSEDKKTAQNQYDVLREKEEGTCRAVVSLSKENVDKIKKLAKDEGASEDKVINDILSDTLL
ncbi:MAG: PAS domain-containing protein [Sulfurospirillaceae bacterium]|nr:PAS domain-containing protein [Sulfurospirillaceae bacterium]